MNHSVLLAACSAVILSACASHVERVPVPTFNSAEHSSYYDNGDATLRGQGYYQLVDGRKVTCEGGLVYFVPDTSYFRELVRIDRRGAILVGNVDPEAKSLVRTATCDSQGRFTAEYFPAGDWLVFTQVAWRSPDLSDSDYDNTVAMSRYAHTDHGISDEVHIIESDATYNVPDYAANRLREEHRHQDVFVAGGECAHPELLGKEDVLPKFCEAPKPVKHKKGHKGPRHAPADWRMQGDK